MSKSSFLIILFVVLLAVSGIMTLSVLVTKQAHFSTSRPSSSSSVSITAQRQSSSPFLQNIVQVDNGIEIEEKYQEDQNQILLAKGMYPEKIMIDQGIILNDQPVEDLNDDQTDRSSSILK